ncbi:MAG: response regulator [Lewinella sp.]
MSKPKDDLVELTTDPADYTQPYLVYAEDNPVDYLFFERAFRNHFPDFPLSHCANGKLVRDFLVDRVESNDGLPKLIVLDIKMPGLSGLEVLEFIRNTPRLSRVPVIMLSASSEGRDIRTAYRHHVNAYVIKPERYGDLKKLIKHMGNFWITYNYNPG